MNVKTRWLTPIVLLALAFPVCAQERDTSFLPLLDAIDFMQGKDSPKEPDKEKKPPDKKSPQVDVFARVLVPRAEAPAGYNPHMLGDFPGFFARRRLTVVGTETTSTTPAPAGSPTTVTTAPASQDRNLLVHTPIRGDFKIAENTSPRPMDRVFVNYNYYGGIRGPKPEDREPIQSSQTTPQVAPVPASVTKQTFIPGAPVVNLHREVLGFEKTFLDGRASVELRIPFLQQTANVGGFEGQNVGDLRVTFKYAFLLDEATGDVFSSGLAVTAPTGPAIETIDGTIRSTLLQPWFGYARNWDRFYVQGFHSIVVPTDPRDVTILFNDVGLGWWMYRRDAGQGLRFVAPTIEVHVTTPLNHRSFEEPIVVPDLVVFTGGVHLGMPRGGVLSLGLATPLSTPRVFGIEAFAQLNWRW